MRAVVDIGSNSVKYTLERKWGDAASRTTKSKVIALGKGLSKGSPLSSEALQRLATTLSEFSVDLAPCKKDILVVGTAALRSCSNPQAARDLVKSILKVDLHIIPGELEAQLSFLGASGDSKFKNPLCVDVGGASTEVGILNSASAVHSVPWGALRVHESILYSQSPVSNETWAVAQATLDQSFAQELTSLSALKNSDIDGVLAIGGSLMMCARSLYPAQHASKTVNATLQELQAYNNQLAPMNNDQRVDKLGLSSDRAEIACAGLMCLFAATVILKNVNLPVLVTEGGLRNGAFLRWESLSRLAI